MTDTPKTWDDYERKFVSVGHQIHKGKQLDAFNEGMHWVFRWLTKEFTSPKHKPPKPTMKFMIKEWINYKEFTLDQIVNKNLTVTLIKGTHKTYQIAHDIGVEIAKAYGHIAIFEDRQIG